MTFKTLEIRIERKSVSDIYSISCKISAYEYSHLDKEKMQTQKDWMSEVGKSNVDQKWVSKVKRLFSMFSAAQDKTTEESHLKPDEFANKSEGIERHYHLLLDFVGFWGPQWGKNE